MRTPWFNLVLLIGALAVSGCGNGIDAIAGAETLSGGSGASPTRSSNAPQMAAILEKSDGGAILRQVARNGDVTTWRAADGDTISLRDGVVIATQSLTPDILSVEGPTPSQWRGMPRPTRSSRVHRYVDGGGEVVIRGYQCEISAPVTDSVTISGKSRATRRTDEACNNVEHSFTNSYWLDNSGELVQSRQWLGEDIGYLRLQHRYP